jgi:hypothetical protein
MLSSFKTPTDSGFAFSRRRFHLMFRRRRLFHLRSGRQD